MASIQLDSVSKIFNQKKAVSDVHLDVPDGEFLVLLGPSGCGKSTLLRMLAGLESITTGTIHLDGRRVDTLPPTERDMAFVFQSYALYPNMTVRRNIAFPLMMRKFRWWYHLPVLSYFIKRAMERDPQITEQVQSVAATLALTEMLDRYPRTLSGGQRQRVALGRAMVRRPEVFLMDEPLSNLDAKLRTTMRGEITKLHKKVGGTFVYVTHDQIEAMTMGSRIALLRDGVVQQFATPREIYERPANTYVARFIGTPPMNLLHAQFEHGALTAAGHTLPIAAAQLPPASCVPETRLIVGVRPNAMRCEPADTPGTLPGRVVLVEHVGAESLITVALDGIRTAHEEGAANDEIVISNTGYSPLQGGDHVGVALDATDCVFFSPTSGTRISQ